MCAIDLNHKLSLKLLDKVRCGFVDERIPYGWRSEGGYVASFAQTLSSDPSGHEFVVGIVSPSHFLC